LDTRGDRGGTWQWSLLAVEPSATRSVHGGGTLRSSGGGKDRERRGYEAGGKGRDRDRRGERDGTERGRDLCARRCPGRRRRRPRVRGAPGRREDRRVRRPGPVREARRDERAGLGGGRQDDGVGIRQA